MKHIDKYSIFENNSEKTYDELVSDVKDMLLELNDEGFNCKVIKQPDVDEAQYGVTFPKGFKLVKIFNVITIYFDKERPGFELDDIEEVYYRIKEYLNSNGYFEEVDKFKPTPAKNTFLHIKGKGKHLRFFVEFINPF